MEFNGKTMTVFGAFSGGGGATTETIIEPSEVLENQCYANGEHVDRDGCDFYWFHIDNKFGSYVRVKAIVPEDSCVLLNDYTNGIWNEYSDSIGEATYVVDKEFPLTGDSFEIGISCVRTEGYPQVIVISMGGGNVEPVSHTSCFDGSYEGEFVDNEITSLRYGAFAECKEITKVSLPNCTRIGGNYAFYYMTNVTEILLPNVSSGLFGGTFNQCANVEIIDMRSLGGVLFDSNCFRYCSNLQTLILGGTEINRLANTNVLGGTPATMSIYVPDDLVDAYKAADYWKTDTIASKIKKWSDYPGGGIK